MQSIDHYLASHHGIITRSEAASCGLSRSQIDNVVRAGRWTPVGSNTYRLAGAPKTWLGEARALALASGGLVSHRAAARVYGLDGFERARLELSVANPVSRARHVGVQWHRSKQMHLADACERRGVPVTGIARTVLDVAAVVSLARLDEVVDDVLRQRLIDWPALYDVLCRHSRRGRNGCGRLRGLLDNRYGDAVVPDSRWNRMVGRLLIESNVPVPVFEHEVHDGQGQLVGRVDLAWPQHRLAVELDSVRFHLNTESFVRDRRRANRLLANGWRVLAFTWRDYVDDPISIVRGVTQQLDAGSVCI